MTLTKSMITFILETFDPIIRTSNPREHPCPKRDNVRVPRASDYWSIHAQDILTFVLQEHTVTKASIPTRHKLCLPRGIRLYRLAPINSRIPFCGTSHRRNQAEAMPHPAQGPFRTCTGHPRIPVCCAPFAATGARRTFSGNYFPKSF